MSRYFLRLAYNGSHFEGWQRQPRGASVQATIEDAMQTILKQPIEIVGCGRTDSGVHASDYYAHFDTEVALAHSFLRSLNALIGYDIAVYELLEMPDTAHARFDAISRSYEYKVSTRKNPFERATSFFIPNAANLDKEKMQAAARMLLNYNEFAPFCKTNTDSHTRVCHLTESFWNFDQPHTWTYRISGNRFLRGMVRLIVGACLNVGAGRLSLETLAQQLDNQQPLPNAWSVEPQGLFLMDIKYPYL